MVGDSNDPFLISVGVQQKLITKHNVVLAEVKQCFYNFSGQKFLEDRREQHKSDPPTLWFISETDAGRQLKICFIMNSDNTFRIKSAFEPNIEELKIFFGQ